MVVTSDEKRKWHPGQRRGSDRPDGKSIAYVNWGDMDQSLGQQIANRRSRPYNSARPHVEAALREHGVTFDKLRWSRYAGCDCPCSGGYTLEGGVPGWDYWVGKPRDEDTLSG